jgi:hypothetical protein
LKKHDYYPALFLAVFSGVACIFSYRLGFGSIRNPGPGLIPFGVAGLLGLMSIGLLVKRLAEATSGRGDEAVFADAAWGRGLAVLCGLLGYGLTFEILGFRLCTFLLMILLLAAVGRQKWWVALAVSFFTVVFAHFIFVVWLGCPFPTGPFRI